MCKCKCMYAHVVVCLTVLKISHQKLHRETLTSHLPHGVDCTAAFHFELLVVELLTCSTLSSDSHKNVFFCFVTKTNYLIATCKIFGTFQRLLVPVYYWAPSESVSIIFNWNISTAFGTSLLLNHVGVFFMFWTAQIAAAHSLLSYCCFEHLCLTVCLCHITKKWRWKHSPYR